MGKSSSPPPPDYSTPAKIQGQEAINNTITASALSNPNQVTPYGTVTYSNPQLDAYNKAYSAWQSGGSKGPPPQMPQINPGSTTMTTSLSPNEQKLFDAQQQAQLGAAGFLPGAEKSLSNVTGNIDLSGLPNATQGAQDINNNVVNALYNQQTQYLDPQFQQQQDSMAASLRAQGLNPNDKAYQNAMQNFGLTKQQAYGNALEDAQKQGTQAGYLAQQENIAGANQGIQEQMLKQQFPMETLQQLMSFAQPQGPGVQGTAGASTASPADLLGATQASYNAQLGQTNANNAMSSNTLGTLGSLGMLAYMAA